jgi:hypothetical protein
MKWENGMKREFIVFLLVFQITLLLVPMEAIAMSTGAISSPSQATIESTQISESVDSGSSQADTSKAISDSSVRAARRVEEFDQIMWERINCRRPLLDAPWMPFENRYGSPSAEVALPTNHTEADRPISITGDYIPMDNAESSILWNAEEIQMDTLIEGDDVDCDDTGFYPYTITNSYATPEMSPAKDAHWFIKKSYSVLAFEFINPSLSEVHLYIDVERDQDIYSRYLTFYLDGSLTHQYVIGSGGFHGAVVFYNVFEGPHKVEVAVNYCGWKEHQWKVTYIWPFVPVLYASPMPIYQFCEYFPHGSYPTLEWQVQAGLDTHIHIDTDVMAGSTFSIKLYINDQLRAILSAGGEYDLVMGTYADDELLNMKLKILSSSNTYYGTKIDYLSVSHRVVMLEIDYMVDQNQDPLVSIPDINSMASYVRSYYIMHGYARCDYVVDDSIPWDEETTLFEEHRDTYYAYCNHQFDATYEWVFILNSAGKGVRGYHYQHDSGSWGWGIGLCTYYLTTLDKLKTTLLHEFGHHAGIIVLDSNNKEVYCGNVYCCMASGHYKDSPNPWYCILHWSVRDYPFTPQD